MLFLERPPSGGPDRVYLDPRRGRFQNPGVADEKLRLAWLAVRGGPLNGRRYEPDEVVTTILIGSDPDCHLVFADRPGVSPIHARIEAGLGESVVHETHAPAGLWINRTRVETQAPLAPGDLIWLGPPDDPDSTCVECRFEPWVEVLPTSVVDSVPGTPILPEGEPELHVDAATALAEAFATPEAIAGPAQVPAAPGHVPVTDEVPTAAEEPFAAADFVGDPEEVVAGPDEIVATPEEIVATPEEIVAAPEEVPATAATAPSPEDDPFFVGVQDASFIPPSTPPPLAEKPSSLGPVIPLAPATPTTPVAPVQSLSPEALIAETLPEDWAIGEPEPPAAPPRPAPASARPSKPPAATADEFFIAEDAGAAGHVPAQPAPEQPPAAAERATPPPKAPSPVAPPAAPAHPQRFVPESHPEEAPRPRAGAPTRSGAVEPRRAESGGAPASPRPAPTPARRPGPLTPRPGGAARSAPVRRSSARPARRPSPAAPGWVRPVTLGAGGALLVGALAFALLRLLGGGVRLDAVEPARLRVGQRATLAGAGFSADPSGDTVLFDDRQAKVVQASATRLEVEVPDVVAESGAEKSVVVVVRRGSRASRPLEVPVFQGPRLHGISPAAALPGEVVLLAGAGWGPGATVRFGTAEARIEEVDASRIRAVVPEGAGAPGTSAPAVVTVGGVESNSAPFVVGHLPVVSGVAPATAAAGDVVDVAGLGFAADPLANEVRVGGEPALVVSSAPDSLKVVVPLVGPGDPSRALEVRVPGSTSVGQAVLQVPAPADPVAFHFVAEPFVAAPGRPHAVLATGLGPVFVLAASGGRTAAARAVEGTTRLNGAAEALRTMLGQNLEARDVDTSPTLGLAGRPETLLEVTAEDAAAYGEDWSGLRGRGGPVTRARLARWWEAVARDIVLLTVRSERPQFAAALAPEGRVLGQLFDAAQRTGRPGVPRQVLEEARPALRDGLRLLAVRVPPSVPGPAAPAAPAPAVPTAAATPRLGPLALEGTWAGSQTEAGGRQYLTVRFRSNGGSIAYESGITLTVPLLTLEQTGRDQARFSVQFHGGVRHYAATWDGEKLSGPVSTDAAGKNVVASFELRKR
jgi:FHA domain-containing protein/IPT/TIG domain-containing protein